MPPICASDGLGIGLLERRRAAAAAAARPLALAGAHHQQVGAQAGDLRLHRLRGAVAQRDHGDHGADADHDAQDGEERAQQVAPDRAQREQQGVEQHQRCSAPQRRGGRRRRVRVGRVAVDAAVDEMHHAPGVGRHVGLVRDHQHGDAVVHVQAPQQLHDLAAALGVEVAGGLVGQQHRRLGDDGAGDRHALLLAARQLGRRVVLPAAPGPPTAAPWRAAARRTAALSPRYSSGSSTFSCAEVRASRLKPWNTKPR